MPPDAGSGHARVGRATADPFHQCGGVGIREPAPFFLRRHLRPVLDVPHGHADQQAVLGFAGHDRRSAIAPFLPTFARIEGQPAAGLSSGRRVARFTPLGQQRPNALFEEIGIAVGPGRGGGQPQASAGEQPARATRR